MTRVMVKDDPSTSPPAELSGNGAPPDEEAWARSRFVGLPHEPLTDADLRRWPFGIGAVETRDGITFFRSRHPDGFTADDLRQTPEDGRRYELLDGTIAVSPSPGFTHQLVVAHLLAILVGAQTGTARTLPAPFDVALPRGRVLQPDIVVMPHAQAKIPVLVVEVLSRYGRGYDRKEKFDEYERSGIPSYWIIDPDIPEISVFELTAGRYERVTRVEGSATCKVERPFPVSFSPAALPA
ncbi:MULTISPECIES: Uma2 family endonuclease [Protofrankia]|uniref:Putative restriction endonuclease domain-containing protein n=1 Tax=Candidatus Protofrankia datiscae TaxID=2716812 RepID=F8B5K1_9ACTN|nr:MULTISPECIES: Uma2 family endonuclease [Protofrankia]AEH09171.1 protein of unknown function DUF820 [Candidatus Protofrankia datiscae]